LDGEIICGDPTASDCYRRTDSFTMSFNGDDDFTFYVFDMWNHPHFFEDRIHDSEQRVKKLDSSWCILAKTDLVWSIQEIEDLCAGMMSLGHEGIILRNPKSRYKYGRGSPIRGECIKVKEGGWVDTECRVLQLHEQLQNANEAKINDLGFTERSGHQANLVPKGTLGAMTVQGRFEDGREFICRVGTGLDDEIRQRVWDDQSDYVGRLIKMKYFNVGIKDKPRFPTFLGFRDPDDMDLESESTQGDLFS
jgi:DNA ligase-1